MPNKHKVTIFFTKTCPWCHKTMDWLTAHKIKFTSIDVGDDQKALDDMVKKSNQIGVPVIDIDGQIIIGFDEQKLKKALNIK